MEHRCHAAICGMLQVQPAAADIPVVVVGDTHGQLHDVCAM